MIAHDFDGAPEAFILQKRKFHIALRRAEVGKHALHAHIGAVFPPVHKQRAQIIRAAHADAGHAGIDLQMRQRGFAALRRRALQCVQRMRIVYRLRCIRAHRLRQRFIRRAAQNQYRGGDARRAKHFRFLHDGDRERIRARAKHGARRVYAAVAVGVRLDHAHQLLIARYRRANRRRVAVQRALGYDHSG